MFSSCLISGLNELLEYPDMDMEDTLMQTFSISYKDVFGVVYNHELKVLTYIHSFKNKLYLNIYI